MTIDQVIKLTENLYPGNRFDNDIKTLWLSEVDGKVFEEIVYPAIDIKGDPSMIVTFWKEGREWKNSLMRSRVRDDESEQNGEETEQGGANAEQIARYAEQIDPLNMRNCRRIGRPVGELRPYVFTRDQNTHLLIPDRFSDVYTHYLIAKMHAADGEIEDYNNEVVLFVSSYADFSAWHLRNFVRKTADQFTF